MPTRVLAHTLDMPETRVYRFSPQEDIKVHELALIISVIFNERGGGITRSNLVRRIEALPESARRHFVLRGEALMVN